MEGEYTAPNPEPLASGMSKKESFIMNELVSWRCPTTTMDFMELFLELFGKAEDNARLVALSSSVNRAGSSSVNIRISAGAGTAVANRPGVAGVQVGNRRLAYHER